MCQFKATIEKPEHIGQAPRSNRHYPLGTISPMTERITFEPGEFSLPTADLCETNEVMCWVRGGTELCPGMETIDPAKVEGDMPDSGIVFCICECHRLAPTI